ncbi:MAG: N-acetylmuramoyl-L-alanine amidase [Desulfitobacteriaceae bacterium]
MHRWGRRQTLLGFSAFLILVWVLGVVLRVQPKDTKSWSWSMGRKIIVIDAGHGGPDPGAVGKTKVLEKDVTLAVAKRVQAFVQQGGGKAIMIRDEDEDLGTSQGLAKRKREDLAQRIQISEDSQADVYLSIHANSFPNEKLVGPQVFYYTDSPEGRVLAQAIQQELNRMVDGKRVAKANKDFFILKKAHQAAVTTELGFLSNPNEEQLLITSEYQQKLAWAIYQGLCDYLAKQDPAKVPAKNSSS